ncbi:hypothetical protein [Spirosoma daeguense]
MKNEIILTNPVTIKAYFEKVRQLVKDGQEYPVSLDEVWPLVYAEKGVAIRVLKKGFFENEDYKVFDQNVKNSNGGRPEKEYRLTSSCMEHLVARKVKEVFEVYRQVFHKTADAMEQQTLPATQDELILMLAQRNVETSKRLSVVEEKLERIEQNQQAATAELLAIPAPTEEMPDMATESKIIRLVNLYAQAKSVLQVEVWRMLYTELLYRYRISVNAYNRGPKETKIQLLKRLGHLDKLYTIATNILQVNATPATT